MIVTNKPEKQPAIEAIKRSTPRAVLAALLALACLAGVAFVVYKAFLSDEWSLLTAALLLTALTPPYAWALHGAFLYGSGDKKAAKRKALIALAVTAVVAAAIVIVTVAVELLAGLIGGAFAGGSDSDSDNESDSSGGSGGGWHFGGIGPEASGSTNRTYHGSGEGPYGLATGRGQAGLCGGCGRRMASSFGLCAGCSMPRY